MTSALATRNVQKHFGEFAAVDNVSLDVRRGARHALIGPNGAGKTTLVNLLAGVLRPSGGAILLEGADVTSMPVHERVGRGLSRTFQINQLFGDLTPLESVALAIAQRRQRTARWWRAIGRDAELTSESIEHLDRFGMLDAAASQTTSLPYGKQRMLEIALALAAQPRVLLLDEPAAGVPDSERHHILAMLGALPRDVTVVLIEHDMDLVFGFADRITVLANGATLAEGTPDEVAADSRVREVYLGPTPHG